MVDGGFDSEKTCDDSSGVVETWFDVSSLRRKSCEMHDRRDVTFESGAEI